MARSLVGGLVANAFDRDSIQVSDPEEAARLHITENYGVRVTQINEEVVANSSIVILAVKPNTVRHVLNSAEIALQHNRPLLISIAAGIQLGDLDTWSGGTLAIVRVMPNTPALIQKGISAMFANDQVTSTQKEQAQSILSAVGKTIWLSEESALDAVTAISGSGPAYFFYLIEAIEQAAKNLGLNSKTAHALAIETAVGSALLAAQSDEPAAELRKRVTSPGGVTEAAVNTLETAGVKNSFIQAIIAGQRRSVEMSKPASGAIDQ